MSKNFIKSKTNEFLSNKYNKDALQAIIQHFKESKDKQLPTTAYILSLELICIDLLKTSIMNIAVVPLEPRELTADDNHKIWIRDRYEEAFELILDCVESEKPSEAQEALNTCFKILMNEGLNPLDDQLNEQPFPILKLNKIISKLLLSEHSMKNMIIRLSDYSIYEDFCFYLWKLIMKNLIPANKNDLTSNFIQNFIELLNILIPTQPTVNTREAQVDDDDDRKFMCKNMKLEINVLRKNVNKVWNVIVQWPHTDATQRQLLVLLLEKVLIYLDKPTMLTDYLMDSLDVGGQISLLALQGIFILIHKYNMAYPNIYEKLYMMFEPEIFHMKFKPRLFHLADIFLTSSYLPETLVAAFIKRLARLSLIAPPQDIIIILYFIGNLIIRHPGLKRLICDQNSDGTQEIAEDPFIMDEADPNKANALKSSLWEIQMLRNHVLPNVAQVAKNIVTQPLPNQEWDLSNFLELKEDDLFDQEISKKVREYAITFNRPMELKNQQQTAISRYWKF
ncbi:CLUMA_CG000590, isoform A [Clunio marinus]|uniref:CLUMA_CG000590, isoform A n=1 Tax=Clunio marinus TaxID=568069 RepID=A0A1J1HJW1_9DIPT|nr:CLUMA_CG000590, isoform A [Clunio marinus]